ncbi:O-antigen ligase [Franzmannia pantelleriensis]|uniref:O-antigen ligase n=1 Tax=Franzmannia pantelleriensis TaxID=48727 RepID=A0A1G9EEP6_9GAMM|nr:O-antigen ligase family protein [Halomonas pantelleriensis]SDK74553.1 O-antigen ligase [Halomonas pantelleriensis]
MVTKYIPQVALGGPNRWVGWIAILCYAFFWLLNLDVSRSAEVVVMLCFLVAAWRDRPLLPEQRWLLWLLLAFVLLQLVAAWRGTALFPETADHQWDFSRYYLKLFLCIAVAWWIKGSLRAALVVWGVTLAGLLIALLWHSDVAQWSRALQGRRVDFGFMNAQHTAIYYALLLIAAVALCMYFAFAGKRRWWVSLLVLPVVLFGLAGTLVTQTRGVWGGLVLATLTVLLYWLVAEMRRAGSWRGRWARLGGAGALLLVVVIALSQAWPTVEKRIGAEQQEIQAFLQGNLDAMEMRSVGVRAHTWVYAVEQITERPLVGWGPASRIPLIEEGPFPENVQTRFGHFHNSYLEVLLAYGLLGLGMLGVLLVAVIKGLRQLARRGREGLYLSGSLAASFLMMAVANLFESYLVFRTGIYFFVLAGGVGLSFFMYRDNKRAV